MSKTNSVELRKMRDSEQRLKDIIKTVRALIQASGAREITLRKVAEKAAFRPQLSTTCSRTRPR